MADAVAAPGGRSGRLTGGPARPVPSKLDTTRPHSARVWNYWLGGKDNFGPDREVGEKVRQVFPAIVDNARASRAFLVRVVRHLAGTEGVDQFLDLGTGLPTANNTHEVAQAVRPRTRVVYVDNDPVVLIHARALLTSAPEGATDYVEADARDTDLVLRAAGRTLDLRRPVAVMMLNLLGNIPDHAEGRALVRRLTDAVSPGSYLVIADGTSTSAAVVAGARVSAEGGHAYTLRTPEQVAGFFDGWQLLEPGVVPCPRWRPESPDDVADLEAYCGVGRKADKRLPEAAATSSAADQRA